MHCASRRFGAHDGAVCLPPQEAYAASVGIGAIDISQDGYTLYIRPSGTSVVNNTVVTLKNGLNGSGNPSTIMESSEQSTIVKDKDKKTFYTYKELKQRVRSIVIVGNDKLKLPSDATYYFSGFKSVTSINGANKIDTSGVNLIGGMFKGCSSLSSLDVADWDVSQVTNTRFMFQGCGVTSLNLSKWDTSKVEIMGSMFDGASRLSSITFLKSATTNPVTKQPVYEGFKTNAVIDMSSMFEDCGVTSLDLRSFTVKSGGAVNMSNMFTDSNVSSLDLSTFDTKTKQPNMTGMFDGCRNLSSVTIGNNFEFRDDSLLPGRGSNKETIYWQNSNYSSYTTFTPEEVKATPFAGTWTATRTSDPKKPEKEEQQPGTPTIALITPVSGPMFRMYNPNSGEHFYTGSEAERNNLVSVGWIHEGTGWVGPEEGAEVYRLYNPNTGDHHYTPNAAERNMLVGAGWKYEGAGWYSSGDVPVYRQYNPNAKGAGSHNYTTNAAERDMLISKGWRDEGIGWYTTA